MICELHLPRKQPQKPRNSFIYDCFFPRLALLWYHTIVRPFYALDGRNVQAGVEVSKQLLDESKEIYQDSALFLFFTGRVHRLSVRKTNLWLKSLHHSHLVSVGNSRSVERLLVIGGEHWSSGGENSFDARNRLVLFDSVGLQRG